MLSFKLSSYYHGNCVLRLFFHPLKNGQRDVCLFKLIRFSLLSFYLYFLKVTLEDQTMPLVIKLTCSGLSRLPDPVGLEILRDLSHRESQMWGGPPHFPFSFPSQVPSFHLWSRWLLLPGPAEMPSWGSGSFSKETAAIAGSVSSQEPGVQHQAGPAYWAWEEHQGQPSVWTQVRCCLWGELFPNLYT